MLKGIFLAVTAIVFAQQAHSKLRFCNKTPKPIDVAVAYDIGGAFGDWWQARGWYTIPALACSVVEPSRTVGRYYFYYARSGDSRWDGQDRAFSACIAEQDFERVAHFQTKKECDAVDGSWVHMIRIDTGTYSNAIYTVNIPPGATTQPAAGETASTSAPSRSGQPSPGCVKDLFNDGRVVRLRNDCQGEVVVELIRTCRTLGAFGERRAETTVPAGLTAEVAFNDKFGTYCNTIADHRLDGIGSQRYK